MFYSTAEMSGLFAREAHVRAMLRFEAALARAEARAGIIPEGAARDIAEGCQSLPIETGQLFDDAIRAGTLAIPLVKSLTSHVGPESGAYVHWGATSQDAIDTAFMLQCKSGLEVIETRIIRIADRLAELSREHRATPMVGRTLTQQALPITFGLKAARWLSMFSRQVERLQRVRSNELALQFGGAVGTLASIDASGPGVQRHLAEELGLPAPDLPWHTERDRIVEIGSALGLTAGCVQKVTADLLSLAQSEVGEVSERAEAGKGGSSTMPHKRNPVDLVGASASARRATETASTFFNGMAQEHERSAGVWQAEWERLPDLFQQTDYALERLSAALDGLEVHADRMETNLNLSQGLIMAESLAMALAGRIGRIEAYRLVDAASQRSISTGVPLSVVCREEAEIREVLSDEEITRALDPSNYLGSTDTFIDTALATFASISRA